MSDSPTSGRSLTDRIRWARGVDVKGPAKALLVVMATYTDDGAACWPSAYTLRDDTGFSLATVRRHLKRLVSEGHLIAAGTRTCSHGKVNAYRLSLVQNRSHCDHGGQSDHGQSGSNRSHSDHRSQGDYGTVVTVTPHRSQGDYQRAKEEELAQLASPESEWDRYRSAFLERSPGAVMGQLKGGSFEACVKRHGLDSVRLVVDWLTSAPETDRHRRTWEARHPQAPMRGNWFEDLLRDATAWRDAGMPGAPEEIRGTSDAAGEAWAWMARCKPVLNDDINERPRSDFTKPAETMAFTLLGAAEQEAGLEMFGFDRRDDADQQRRARLAWQRAIVPEVKRRVAAMMRIGGWPRLLRGMRAGDPEVRRAFLEAYDEVRAHEDATSDQASEPRRTAGCAS